MNDDDTQRIAGTVRLAGDLLDAHGGLMLELIESWRHGPRSPNLDPNAGGWRYEVIVHPDGTEETVSIPSDSTGESALRGDPDGLLMQETTALLKRLSTDAARLRDIIASTVPPSAGAVSNDTEDWCSNHLRIQQCEPRHRGDLCRGCYDFKNLWKRLPPPSVMGHRHRYGRITEQQIKDFLAREQRHDETLSRVNDAVRSGRRKQLAPVEPRHAEQVPTEEDRRANIEDRRTKRLEAS